MHKKIFGIILFFIIAFAHCLGQQSRSINDYWPHYKTVVWQNWKTDMAITIALAALVGICITYTRLYVAQATACNTMFRGAMGGALIGGRCSNDATWLYKIYKD